jgi:hypothetical protein
MSEENVHKDFHGALSYGIQHVVDNFGLDVLHRYLDGLADTVYAPLVKALRADGLDAMCQHLEQTFTREQGHYEVRREGETLVFDVKECPAIAHMKAQGYAIAPHFCEHTRILNDAICRRAGYACSVDYDQEAGQCVQRFWKEDA